VFETEAGAKLGRDILRTKLTDRHEHVDNVDSTTMCLAVEHEENSKSDMTSSQQRGSSWVLLAWTR
jgi:hypothetical protein